MEPRNRELGLFQAEHFCLVVLLSKANETSDHMDSDFDISVYKVTNVLSKISPFVFVLNPIPYGISIPAVLRGGGKIRPPSQKHISECYIPILLYIQ